MITTRQQQFTATTTRRMIRPVDRERVAFTMQNQEAAGGSSITIATQQTGAGFILQPGETFGRDIFAPASEIWIQSSAGTASFVLGEDYEG